MTHLNLTSADVLADNIQYIADRFPHVVTEAKGVDGRVQAKIDWDMLRQEFADRVVDGPAERYQLTWPGKRAALLAANSPTARTLRPKRNESVDFETTQNLFIEGDNLDVLKLLQEPLLGRATMIYICLLYTSPSPRD